MIRVWRDAPKRGESDAGWCFSVSRNGHIIWSAVGFETEAEARAAAESREKA